MIMDFDPSSKELPRDQYRLAMQELPLVTIDVLFFNADGTKILLGKRRNEPYAGVFFSFGGRLYKNEELIDAACRVAEKEVGVTLSPSDLTFGGVYNEISPNSVFEGINYHAVDIYFYTLIGDTDVELDDQHTEARWFPVEDPNIHPNVRARIDGACAAMRGDSVLAI